LQRFRDAGVVTACGDAARLLFPTPAARRCGGEPCPPSTGPRSYTPRLSVSLFLQVGFLCSVLMSVVSPCFFDPKHLSRPHCKRLPSLGGQELAPCACLAVQCSRPATPRPHFPSVEESIPPCPELFQAFSPALPPPRLKRATALANFSGPALFFTPARSRRLPGRYVFVFFSFHQASFPSLLLPAAGVWRRLDNAPVG